MSSKRRIVFKSKNGSIYQGELSNSKVKVTTTRTAQGQTFIDGVFDVNTKEWHNDKKLPHDVRKRIESEFA